MDFGDDNGWGSSEATNMAEIVNETQQVLDMRVRNSVYSVRLARLRRGAAHTVLANYTDTYQVYEFSPRGSRKDTSTSSSVVVVTSDDCCDCKRIVITEVDGQLEVQRERRVCSEEVVVLQDNSAASPDEVLQRDPAPDEGLQRDPAPDEVPQRDPAPDEVPQRECGSDVGAFIWNWWIRPGIV